MASIRITTAIRSPKTPPSALATPFATGSVAGGSVWDVSGIVGVNSPDGKGNVEGYFDYRSTSPVLGSDRDYSACTLALNHAKNGFNCGGSATNPSGSFLVYNKAFTTNVGFFHIDKNAPGFVGEGEGTPFNYGALNYFQRSDTRYSGGFFGHYDINSHIQAYGSFMFMDDFTVAQIAPSGVFGSTYSISCSNPLLSAQEVSAVCNAAGVDPTVPGARSPNVIILRRNVEGGNRQDTLRHDDYRFNVGLKGDLAPNWTYNIYGQFSQANFSEEYLNDVSKKKVANSLDVVTDPATGQPTCASVLNGNDKACVPYNIWAPGGVTKAALDYIAAPGFQNGYTSQQIVEGTITGDLGGYGWTSPFAKDGVGVAMGASYQQNTLAFNTDNEFATGDLYGQGAVTPSQHGQINVMELYGEARVPIVQDREFFKDLTASLGYRFSDYSVSGGVSAYQIGANWAITEDIRLRGGFNRSVRAPSILELYTAQHLALDGGSDNCTGTTPVFTEAQCANTGVSAAQYGHVLANPASQYNGIIGGNTDLKPEESNNWTVGFVLTPHKYVRGLDLSVDYFNLKINNVIQSYGADNILDQCALTGNATYCSLVTRAPNTASLWLGTQGFVTDIEQNQGSLSTSGIDFALNYHVNLDDWGVHNMGALNLAFLGTWTDTYAISGITGTINCVGLYGVTCQGSSSPMSAPLPAFKSQTRLTWTTPLKGLDTAVSWRYFGPINVDTGATGTADSNIQAYNWFDLSFNYRWKDRYTFTGGVNNLFDRDPPLIGSGEIPSVIGNNNTIPGDWDSLGRYFFMGVTADF